MSIILCRFWKNLRWLETKWTQEKRHLRVLRLRCLMPRSPSWINVPSPQVLVSSYTPCGRRVPGTISCASQITSVPTGLYSVQTCLSITMLSWPLCYIGRRIFAKLSKKSLTMLIVYHSLMLITTLSVAVPLAVKVRAMHLEVQEPLSFDFRLIVDKYGFPWVVSWMLLFSRLYHFCE